VRRLCTLALLVASLAFALSACGGSSGPQEIVDEATFQGIESADLDLALGVDVVGKEGGHVDVSLSGPFQSEEAPESPHLDLTAKAKGKIGGEKINLDAGLTLLDGEAYVRYEGTEYEVDATTYGFVKSLLRRRGKAGEPEEVTACQAGLDKLKVSDFIDGASDEGSADVGGAETTKVGGELDADGALDALIELSEDPDCSGQLKAASGSNLSTARLKKARGEVGEAIKQAHVELYVGDDHIVRRIVVEATIEPQGSGRKSAKSAQVDLDLTLDGVNEEQTISGPRNSKPLSDLFLKLGVNPIELLGLLEGQGGALGGSSLNNLLERIGGQ
jgi:hypothetical protein